MSDELDFTVVTHNNETGEVAVTSTGDITEKWVQEAVDQFSKSGRQYSAFLKADWRSGTLTRDRINELSVNSQDNLSKTLEINRYAHEYANKNDIIGLVTSAIRTNINTQYRISYKDFSNAKGGGRNKTATAKKARAIIDDFNTQINIKRIIRESVPGTYIDGTYVMCLRTDNGSYVVDYYPLGVATIAPYMQGGEPIVLIDMDMLTSCLEKAIPKRRGGKALFFERLEEEIKNNYPAEVYDAYKSKDKYAKLNVDYTGVMRIGNFGHCYGISQVFRALEAILLLDSYDSADDTTAKVRAKKILFQKMRKELLGDNAGRTGYKETVYAHGELLKAASQSTVVYTSPPSVEELKFVESTGSLTDPDTNMYQRNRALTTLGIGFLATGDGAQTLTTANLSLDQLMRTINCISEGLEDILLKWYKVVLAENGIPVEFAPKKINIIDSEQLSAELKNTIATTLFGTFNSSMETAFDILGIDIEDETMRRQAENEKNLEEVFKPRLTAYTNSGANNTNQEGGRPSNEGGDVTDPNKQEYDKLYNKDGR